MADLEHHRLYAIFAEPGFDKESDVLGLDRRPFVRPHRTAYCRSTGRFEQVEMGTKEAVHCRRVIDCCMQPPDARVDQGDCVDAYACGHRIC